VHPNGAVQDIRWRYLQYRGIREIDCLDPGGFGALTITKAITIDCDETLGGILAEGTNGIVVNTATTDTVTLKGLDMEGFGHRTRITCECVIFYAMAKEAKRSLSTAQGRRIVSYAPK
jgi:hypothetical protein